MIEQRWSTQRPDDDSTFLAGLLMASGVEPSQPARQLRPAALRTKEQLRREALSGYRFRTRFDYLLIRLERILFIAIIGFFAWWLADGYGRDMLHRLRQPARPPVNLESVVPGASAAELTTQLGESLPYIRTSDVTARPPDYLIPAQSFPLLLAPTPTPQPADPRPFRLIVPAMNLDTPVHEVFLENGIWQVAEYAAGYHHGTALPGEGNTVLAGHAGIRGAVFARLGDLKPGDDVYLDAGTTRYHYRVRSSRNVWPHEVQVMYPTAEPIVTMITCTAWDTQRLVVVAELLDTAPLPPAERANTRTEEMSP